MGVPRASDLPDEASAGRECGGSAVVVGGGYGAAAEGMGPDGAKSQRYIMNRTGVIYQ